MDHENKPIRRYAGQIPAATVKWMEERATAFQIATSSKQGKPQDGVTYGKGKARGDSE